MAHTVEAMVRGYHVYKDVWCAAVGEEVSCVREVNYHDRFAIAVMRFGVVVGHVPRKNIIGMFDVLKAKWNNSWQQTLL